jgi:hypothetical protein
MTGQKMLWWSLRSIVLWKIHKSWQGSSGGMPLGLPTEANSRDPLGFSVWDGFVVSARLIKRYSFEVSFCIISFADWMSSISRMCSAAPSSRSGGPRSAFSQPRDAG